MDKHILHGEHNHCFHNSIQIQFPDNYFDWKVTCLFYTALHYMRAYIIGKGLNPGTSHTEIEKLIKFGMPVRARLEVSKTCWENYRNLYQYSRTARYEGFIDIEGFMNDRKVDHVYSDKCLTDIIKYLKGREIPLNLTPVEIKKEEKKTA